MIDSCGTAGYHIGEPPHRMAQKVALERGLPNLRELRARKIQESDFDTFHYILPMDYNNYEDLMQIRPIQSKAKITLFRTYDPEINNSRKAPEMPDPYYGNKQSFYLVQNIALLTTKHFLQFLLKKHASELNL